MKLARLLLVLTLASAFAASSTAVAAAAGGTAEPIENIVVIVEQNHTFDSYFGRYPGANGFDDVKSFPYGPGTGVGEVLPVRYRAGTERLDRKCCANGRGAALTAYAGGTMQGFAQASVDRGFPATSAMQYHTPETAKGLWDLADNFVLFDNYFSAALGGSFPNVLSLISGRTWGYTEGTKGSLRDIAQRPRATIFDELERAGVSWKYYVGGLEAVDAGMVLGGDYLRPGVRTPPQLYWAPVLAMRRFWTQYQLRSKIAAQADFYADAARGDLPAVSFVLPSPTDHPPVPQLRAQARLLGLLNAVAKSAQWKRSATFVVWDDWGGFYDHVTPPRGLGFRVPALLVSPFAKRGHVSHVQQSHVSLSRFIAERFGLKRFSGPQGDSRGFADAFDFHAGARQPELFSLVPVPSPRLPTSHQARATLLLYLGTLEFIALTLLAAWVFRRRRVRRELGRGNASWVHAFAGGIRNGGRRNGGRPAASVSDFSVRRRADLGLCIVCGEPLALCLARLGSTKCHQCRGAEVVLAGPEQDGASAGLLAFGQRRRRQRRQAG